MNEIIKFYSRDGRFATSITHRNPNIKPFHVGELVFLHPNNYNWQPPYPFDKAQMVLDIEWVKRTKKWMISVLCQATLKKRKVDSILMQSDCWLPAEEYLLLSPLLNRHFDMKPFISKERPPTIVQQNCDTWLSKQFNLRKARRKIVTNHYGTIFGNESDE